MIIQVMSTESQYFCPHFDPIHCVLAHRVLLRASQHPQVDHYHGSEVFRPAAVLVPHQVSVWNEWVKVDVEECLCQRFVQW